MGRARCPGELEPAFIEDVKLGMSTRELAEEYGKARRTIREWKLVLREEGKLEEEEEPSVGIKFIENGNYARAVGNGVTIKSPEELIEVANIDLGVWKKLKSGAKVWQLGAKVRHSDLKFSEGKIVEGWIKDQGIGKTNLWSIWVTFIRRNPVPVSPVIQPIRCDYAYEPPPPAHGDITSAFIICDLQGGYRRRIKNAALIPFHDRRILDLGLQICIDEQPEIIVFNGDTLDLTEFTDKWVKEPSFYFTMQPLILEMYWWLGQYREMCPNSRIIVCQGNHEARLDMAMLKHLVAGYGLRAADEIELSPQLSLPRLLALHKLGIEWSGDYPNDDVWLESWLRVKHGHKVRNVPGGTAKQILEDGVSTIFAHCHRSESASRVIVTEGGEKTIKAITFGCACHLDHRVPGHKIGDNWQSGFGMVEYTGKEDISTISAEVKDGLVIWKGELYEGRERVEDLRKNIPDWNW